MMGRWPTPRPDHFAPGKETQYPLYTRLGGPQGRAGRVRKISPPPLPGFDPRTIQPVSSRYTDWAIPAHTITTSKWKLFVNGCDCENSPSATAKEYLNTGHDGGLKLFCDTAQVVHLMKLYCTMLMWCCIWSSVCEDSGMCVILISAIPYEQAYFPACSEVEASIKERVYKYKRSFWSTFTHFLSAFLFLRRLWMRYNPHLT